MNITVSTGDWARRYMPQRQVIVDMPDGAKITDLIERLGIPADEAGLTAVNSKAVPREQALHDGDTVKIYPVIVAG